MSSFSIEMLLKLVDQATGPIRNVIDQMKGVETAAKSANDAMAPKSGGGFSKAADDVRRTREEAEKLGKTLEGIANQQARLALIGDGFRNLGEIGSRISAPVEQMVDAATRFEKATEEMARAAGLLDQRGAMGDSALKLSTETATKWEQINKARRAFFQEGGGDVWDKVAPMEKDLLNFSRASSSAPEDVYKLLFSYIRIGKMSPGQALDAMRVNYLQGKAGSYEFSDMSKNLRGHMATGMTSLGMSGEQAARDLPALLQILRTTGGNRADTYLQNFMKAMTDPATSKRMNEELGIDPAREMAAARAAGENPLLRVANLIADKLAAIPEAERGNVDGESVRGSGEALGATFRNFYVRAFMDAFLGQRDQLARFMPSVGEAREQVATDLASSLSTAAASAERFAAQVEAASIRLGTTQLDDKKKMDERKANAVGVAAGLAQQFPGVTNAAMGAWDFAGKGLEAVGGVGNAVSTGLVGYLGWKALTTKYPALGTFTSNAVGAAKGVVTAPWNMATGFAQGVASEVSATPGATQALKTVGQGLARGVLLGAATYGAQYAMDKGFEALPKPAMPEGYDPQARLNEGVFGRFMRVWNNITGSDAGAARERNRQQLFETGGQVNAAPLEGAKTAAAEAGEEIKSALSVTATPIVDASSIDASLEKARALNAELAKSGALATQAAQSISRASSQARSSGALHDGFETR